MPSYVRMVALDRFIYAGKSLKADDEFDCEEDHVHVLTLIGHARVASKPKNGLSYGTRAMTARRGKALQ